ncbi:PP2C family protein-serine/threonine phosphatase [Chakrabartyella piscis]|uniref:PP2C family protein-serine/threonine phosphatase n=1 Tax=Chakrabartyella piscis TaxID=2918914 RepID=UPI0029586584|nr:PP2C family protein-serine/threonine phosphatase [Chakrabartyella piscis]
MGEDFFKKNEADTTQYIIKSLIVTIVFGLLIWALNIAHIFTVDQKIMGIAMPLGLIVFALPYISSKLFDIELSTLKNLSILCFIVGIAIMNVGMTYQAIIAWTVPIFIASHLYSQRITVATFIIILVLMLISTYMGLFFGNWDSNMMNSTEVIYGFQERLDFIATKKAGGRDIIVNVFVLYYIPRALTVLGFYFIDVTLSKRTHSLLQKQAEQYWEREHIAAELSIATEIQNSALPNVELEFCGQKEFDVVASMTPSKEVGGDFYDAFMIDEDHVALVIADVSGKGVPAAMFMMATKIMIKNTITSHHTPAEVLMAVNNQLCETNESDMFVTVWLGIYEISTGKLTASNAGHEYPVIQKKGGDYEIFKDKHGFVIGGMENVKYRDYEMQLEQGDTLFVYTDGILEAIDKDNQAYGFGRLIDKLNSVKSFSLEYILKNVETDINIFAGEMQQFDDITMLAFKRN